MLQCSDFIRTNSLINQEVFDTAGSVLILKKNRNNPKFKNYGAIASNIAAKEYGLKLIKENIQDFRFNYTRFLIIRPIDSRLELCFKKNKVSVIFETRDIPAALYKCLGGFVTNGINLTKIESRHKRNDKIFDYLFYLNFEGNLENKNVKNALKKMDFFSKNLKIFGNYQKFDFV